MTVNINKIADYNTDKLNLLVYSSKERNKSILLDKNKTKSSTVLIILKYY